MTMIFSWFGVRTDGTEIELATGIDFGTSGNSTITVPYVNTEAFPLYRLKQTSGPTLNADRWLSEAEFKGYADVGDNDVVITWQRRDRLSPPDAFITDPMPMSEAHELYVVEILDAFGAVVRTLPVVTHPLAVYTEAMQTEDGLTPPISSLRVKVYQIGVGGEPAGRGFGKDITLEVA